MRALLVFAIYLPLAFLCLGLMAAPMGEEAFPAVYLAWVIIFGYGGGWAAYELGLSDWMLK